MTRNDIDLVVRGHQIVKKGYEFFSDQRLVTIFGASNYCGEYNNNGALMSVDEILTCSFTILKSLKFTDKNQEQTKTDSSLN